MTNLVERLTEAIFRQEGRGLGNPNPGDLRDCPWFPKNPNKRRYYPHTYPLQLVEYTADGFWLPRSRSEGVAGAAHVVALHIAQGNSLAELITIWAPPTDHNDTATYIKNVKEWAAIPDENKPLWNFLEGVPT